MELRLGEKQTLVVVKKVEFGVYLATKEAPEDKVLLPAKQVPEGAKVGDELEVFLYRDSSDRLISTTRTPKLCMGQVALLTVVQVGKVGAFLDWGLEKDAHAGNWHRQVSLLSWEEVEKFRARGANVADGAFGENLLVKGYDFKSYPVGSIFKCNEVVLEITQIGKKCHSECEIFHMVGDCIMPREGVFARVLHGGRIDVGDTLKLIRK